MTRAPVDVLTYGETMGLVEMDRIGPLRGGGAAHVSMAGAESTVAIGVARLGGSSRWIGVVGDDELGSLVLARLRGEGVDVSGAVRDSDLPTSLMVKERRTSEHSRVHYYRRGNAGSRLSPAHVSAADVTAASFLHLSGITPALSGSAAEAVDRALDLAAEAGTRVCVDVNHRSRLWGADDARAVLTRMVRRADVVLATLEEASLVTGYDGSDEVAAARSLADLGPGLVVVKRGADGAIALVRDEVVRVAAPTVREVDPVGAGDSFAAGLLADLAVGAPVEQALQTAATVAAINVTCPGDWEGLPTRAELSTLGGDTDVLR